MQKRFLALDSFRGLCAVFVVLFHLTVANSITELSFFKGSSVFVEFFFVLSGFVLAHGYGYGSKIKFINFMKIRFFRLYPLHFFMFIVFFCLELIKYFSYIYGNVSYSIEPFSGSTAIKEILPNLLLIQAWTPWTEHFSFNRASWSISIEFYVYALLFLSIIIFRRFKGIAWLLVSLICFLCIFYNIDALVSPVLRGLSCFFGGAFMYLLYRKFSNISLGFTLGSVIELLLIICVILLVQSEFTQRSTYTSILFLFVVYFFSYESGIVSIMLKTAVLQYLGKLSYSIYMTHAAVILCLIPIARVIHKFTNIELAPFVGGGRVIDLGSEAFNNIFILLLMIFIILISGLTYRFIEVVGVNYGKKYNN